MAFYDAFIWNARTGLAKKYKCDNGDYRAKNSGFKTCVIMALPVNTGKAE
jgi:hypothetical protein